MGGDIPPIGTSGNKHMLLAFRPGQFSEVRQPGNNYAVDQHSKQPIYVPQKEVFPDVK
jgi:NAD(P)H-flavin reductase